jgi:peptidoglycan/xylan/chitin deacetylase (PgdA/CDA1 family)
LILESRLRLLSKRALGIALAACAAGSALVAVQPHPAAAGPPTVISLTFDDGLKNQYKNIAPVLKAAGVKATFYIVSGRVYEKGTDHDDPKQMSWADIRDLAKQGNEIGGHTFAHVALATQTPQQQDTAIKKDVESLRAHGFDPKSFAYPKGDYNGTSIDLVKKYGYTTARRVGPITATSALKAETIPPANPFEVRAPASFKRNVTLDEMKGFVTRAEAVGGWLPLIFHDICDGACPNTDTYAYGLPKSLVSEFITWLKAREGRGTVIKTMSSVLQQNAPKADLRVTVATPKTWKRGRTYVIKVAVKNHGPSTAKYAVVDAKLSPGLTIVNKPGCKKVTRSTLHCASRAFLPGQKFVFSVKVKVSNARALKKVGFSVTGTTTTFDPKPRNNRASFVKVLKKN